jgi:hypothetical protein
MTSDIAQWEWRTFGSDFGTAESLIRQFPARVRSGSEIYVICDTSAANAKIRDGQLDVKLLRERSDDGFERWSPQIKTPFPLSSASIRELFGIWNLTLPPARRESYSQEQFLEEVVARQPGLVAVPVTKERHGFSLNDCVVEIAELRVDGAPMRTMAVESAQLEGVRSTVRLLTLSKFEHVNYVTALKRVRGASILTSSAR